MNSRPSHTYTIELRFTGDDLVPSEITKQLSVEPSNSSDTLAVSSRGRKRRPFWAYNGEGENGFQREWESLDIGLEFLLKKLSSEQKIVAELSKKFKGIWWCGHFQSSFDGGPTISPEVLSGLASYGVPLFIDNYFEDDEPSESE